MQKAFETKLLISYASLAIFRNGNNATVGILQSKSALQ
jgi:hypothetical protein